ncbi:MAG: hypothetical protein JRI68_33700 [Deltaproteobacteria bacterium]|nr:hypothetical protein [Deltaproteobacteria bacterium]
MTTPAPVLRAEHRKVALRFIAVSSVGQGCVAAAMVLGLTALLTWWWVLLGLGAVLMAASLGWIPRSRQLHEDMARADEITVEQVRARAAQLHATQCHFRVSPLRVPAC